MKKGGVRRAPLQASSASRVPKVGELGQPLSRCGDGRGQLAEVLLLQVDLALSSGEDLLLQLLDLRRLPSGLM
jgi:hypothetical protein